MAAVHQLLLALLALQALTCVPGPCYGKRPPRPKHRTSSSASSSSSSSSSSSRAQYYRSLQRHVQSLLQKCPMPGYCIRDQGLPKPSEYLTAPSHPGMQEQKQHIEAFLSGPKYQARLQQLRALPDKRGILISAGKPHHVGNLAVMLHVLRRHLNCTLPVEVAYVGDREVDRKTRRTLTAAFTPLSWLDLAAQKYPAHHNQEYSMDRYEPKIYALYHTSFQQVLMLDADNTPLQDPTYLFESPHMQQHGVMAWLDLWSPTLSSTTFVGHDTVYPLVGLNKQPYWDVLSAGQGHVRRVAESGQLLLDRVRHADVLEWLWMYTSFSKVLYKHVLGDKDTFGYAFAAAGKLHELTAVALPPGVAFKRQNNSWRFHAMTQYDHLGGLAFFHRTFEKWNDVRNMPPLMDVVTGPLPNWFIMSFLGNKSTGLTPDIPQHALRPLQLPYLTLGKTYLNHNSYHLAPAPSFNHRGCPLKVYMEYLELRDLGLPVGQPVGLVQACNRTVMVLAQQVKLAEHGSRGQQQWEVEQDSGRGLQSDTDGSGRSEGEKMESGSRVRDDFAADAGAALDGPEAGLSTVGVQLQSVQPEQAGLGSAASSSSSSSSLERLWPSLNEHVWLRNCRMLWRAVQSGRNRDRELLAAEPRIYTPALQHNGGAGSTKVDSISTRALAGEAAAVTVQHQPEAAAATAAPAPATEFWERWPSCEAASWHVARYMLPDYAEEVGRDDAGQPIAAADAQLAVLQLSNQVAEEIQAGFSGSIGGEGLGPACLMNSYQFLALPAALDWVKKNIDGLPLLRVE